MGGGGGGGGGGASGYEVALLGRVVVGLLEGGLVVCVNTVDSARACTSNIAEVS